MNPTPPEVSPPRSGTLALALAVALSAVPLVVLGRIALLGHDALLHVFIARLDDWGKLFTEIPRTAHPPVFFLALRASVALFGTSPIVYRLVGIAATLGSSWLVGRIVQKTASDRWLPAVAALAFGTSLSATSIGLDVRAYALATLFMLWACLALLTLVEQAFGAPRHRARAVFALTASLALLTHYGTAIFLAGCFVAAAVPAALDREYRRRLLTEGRRHWRANLLALGTPAVVFATVYAAYLVSWKNRLSRHLPGFLFEAGREGALEFVWRNTRALFALLVPPLEYRSIESTLKYHRPELPGALVAVLAVAALAAIAWLGFRPARAGGAGAPTRRVPAIVLITMTALIIALAFLGRYPYGGRLRHQFFLFPFALIVLVLLIDAVARRSGRRLAGLVVGLFALGSVLNAANWLRSYQVPPFDPFQVRTDRFYEQFPAPEAIFVDQFSLIQLFRRHHDRPWRFERRVRGRGPVDVWRVGEAGGGEFYVCLDSHWQLDLSSRLTYLRLAQCLDGTGGRRVVVFHEQHQDIPVRRPIPQTGEIAGQAAAVNLVAERVVAGRAGVWAAFRRR